MPKFESIGDGEIWISHKHRTINLRCPCGCGDLTVLSIHPSRWHVQFDGKAVTLAGPTGGSIWANSGCGSHFLIRNSKVIWMDKIDPGSHQDYAESELDRMLAEGPSRRSLLSRIRGLWRRALKRQ